MEKAEDREGSDQEIQDHQGSPVTTHLNAGKEDQTDPSREEDQDQDLTSDSDRDLTTDHTLRRAPY